MRQSTRSDTDLRHHLAVMRGYRLPSWLRAAVDPDLLAATLCGRITELVPGALALQRVTVGDARANRRRWTLRYSADIAIDNGERQVQLIAALWPPGTALPADTGGVALPELRLTVRAVSGDPGLPALPSLTEPSTARALLQQALRSRTRADVRLVTAQPRLARHKPGNRATVVCELIYPPGADPAWPRTVVAKTYRGDEGSDTYAAMHALWHSRLGGRNGARVAEPLAYLSDSRTLLQGQVPGDRTLADVLLRSAAATGPEDGSLATALGDTADGLAALHACDVRVGPTRDMPAELAASRRLLVRVAPSLPPDTARAAEALLAGVAHRVELHDAMPPGPVHGAFRPAQVLMDGGHSGFIDFDGFGVGEAALDVGRFVARLGELSLTASPPHDAGALIRQRTLADAFVGHYRERAPLSVPRVESWQCLDLAGGIIRSWARARPARAEILLDLLDATLAGST